MNKSILELGKALHKAEQKTIKAGTIAIVSYGECKDYSDCPIIGSECYKGECILP